MSKQTYIALLRGVNVGGKNLMAMKDLRESLANHGFCDVRTYINSGNVLFSAETAAENSSSNRISSAISADFGYDIRVFVITASALKEVITKAPKWWGERPDYKHNAIFVLPPLSAKEMLSRLALPVPEIEMVAFFEQTIFWSAGWADFSRSCLSKISGTPEYLQMTVRNSNTARKLAELGESL